MRAFVPAAAIAAAAGLLTVGPVHAQVPPVETLWAALQQLVAEQGGSLSAARFQGAESDWRAEEVLLVLPDGAGRIALPALRLRGSDRGLTLLPEGAAVVLVEDGPESWRLEIAPEAGLPGRDSLTVSFDGTTAGLDADFGAQRVRLLGAWRGKEPRGESFEGRVASLRADGRLGLNAPHAIDATLRLGALDYRLASPALGPLQDRIDASVRLGGLSLELSGAGLVPGGIQDLDQAFASGLSLRGRLEMQGLATDVDQTSLGQPMRSVSALEQMSIDLAAADGIASADVRLAGLSGQIRGALLNGTTGLQEFMLRLRLPLVQTPAPQPFESLLALRGLTLSPSLLALAGAAAFGDLPLTVETEVNGRLRWLRPVGAAMAQEGAPPLDVTQLLGRLGAAVGASTLSVRYDLALPPGALARMGDAPPQASGTVAIELVGGNAVLGRIQQTGLVPPEQLAMARMLMGALGRPVGEDHLRSDIELRADGTVLVNGLPAPF